MEVAATVEAVMALAERLVEEEDENCRRTGVCMGESDGREEKE